MREKAVLFLAGAIGYIVGLYMITYSTSSILGITVVTGGLVLIPITAPALGYLLRLLMGSKRMPSMREHMVFTAIGFYMSTAAMLMIYLGYEGWRPFILATSIIIAAVSAIAGKR